MAYQCSFCGTTDYDIHDGKCPNNKPALLDQCQRKPMTSTNQLLDERTKTHGDFTVHARVTRELKAIVHAEAAGKLDHSQAEALDMILHKVGRIIAGNPNFRDHWDDIAGYAKLAADRCKP